MLPRKWAPVPLLVSCCYMTIGQGIQLGPFSLPVYRMVLASGCCGCCCEAKRLAGRLNTTDKLMMAWGGWVLFASLFHQWAPGSGPVFASGFIFNISLVYFLIRIWCRDLNELMGLTRIVALSSGARGAGDDLRTRRSAKPLFGVRRRPRGRLRARRRDSIAGSISASHPRRNGRCGLLSADGRHLAAAIGSRLSSAAPRVWG